MESYSPLWNFGKRQRTLGELIDNVKEYVKEYVKEDVKEDVKEYAKEFNRVLAAICWVY